jgi:hypothetical protein
MLAATGGRQVGPSAGKLLMVRNAGRVTRFVVMAVLQAARARSLGLTIDSAYSWGLNRAVFYAAAKRGFRGGSSGEAGGAEGGKDRPARESFRLGDDEAFRDPNAKELVFSIGGQDQTVERFEQQVISRFGTKENFRTAWDEAVQIVAGFDRAILESRQEFYDTVYKPRRDGLSDSWSERFSPPPKSGSRSRT